LICFCNYGIINLRDRQTDRQTDDDDDPHQLEEEEEEEAKAKGGSNISHSTAAATTFCDSSGCQEERRICDCQKE
jgi:hypothetical protein